MTQDSITGGGYLWYDRKLPNQENVADVFDTHKTIPRPRRGHTITTTAITDSKLMYAYILQESPHVKRIADLEL